MGPLTSAGRGNKGKKAREVEAIKFLRAAISNCNLSQRNTCQFTSPRIGLAPSVLGSCCSGHPGPKKFIPETTDLKVVSDLLPDGNSVLLFALSLFWYI